MNKVSKSDARALIRLAAALPKGDKNRRTILRSAKDWIGDAIKNPGRLHKYFGIPEEDDIPVSKIKGEISKLEKKEDRTKEETSLLRALNLALTLKKVNKG
jgi:hypothetical protein